MRWDYKIMYGKFRGKGTVRDFIFQVWYLVESIRVDFECFFKKVTKKEVA